MSPKVDADRNFKQTRLEEDAASPREFRARVKEIEVNDEGV